MKNPNPEKPVDTVLFDLDGTLTDPKAGITRCIRFALGHFEVEVPDADSLVWCIGPPLRASFSTLLDTRDDRVLDQALSLYRKRFSEKGMYENRVYPDVPAALETLKSGGFGIFLATSKPRVFARKILDHFGLARFFKRIYGAELDGRLVDKGELIAHIIRSESLSRDTALMVGDRRFDIDGGKENGVMTAAVTYGYGSTDEIEAAEPDMIFHSLTDLAPFLTNSQGPGRPPLPHG